MSITLSLLLAEFEASPVSPAQGLAYKAPVTLVLRAGAIFFTMMVVIVLPCGPVPTFSLLGFQQPFTGMI